MKFALCQINPTVGALEGNAKKILDFAEKAKKKGANLAIFPEMSLCGYPPRDLLDTPEFVEKNMALVEKIQKTAPLPLIFGFADTNKKPTGKALHNAAAFIDDTGKIHKHHKSLLPTYDVFDEARHFEVAHEIKTSSFQGKKLAIVICEDSWNDESFWGKRIYHTDPMQILAKENPNIFINISASPFSTKWRKLRIEMIQQAAKKYKTPFIYVNQVGSNDDLIFDGGSFAIDKNGKLVCEAKTFEEDLVIFDLEKEMGEKHKVHEDGLESIYEALLLGIRDYVQKCGFKKVLLGLSGGIDSSIVATLACDALGPKNVLGILMPSQFSSQGSLDDAIDLAKNLKMNHKIIPIKSIYLSYIDSLREAFKGTKFDITEENLQARIRGNLLMAFSNKFGYLVVNTGNKSELAVGYCTLYGDMSGGLSVLGDVPKTLVYELCHWRNKKSKVIPKNALTKPPSAELRPNQTDQDSLPPYPILDGILKAYIEDHLPIPQIIKLGYDEKIVKKMIHLVDLNEYKRRQAAVTLRITSKAFGIGRRLPIAQGYTEEALR